MNSGAFHSNGFLAWSYIPIKQFLGVGAQNMSTPPKKEKYNCDWPVFWILENKLVQIKVYYEEKSEYRSFTQNGALTGSFSCNQWLQLS